MLELQSGPDGLRVEVRAQWVGPDLVVIIAGGTRAHVGAVAMAQPRPSLRGDGTISSTASVFTVLGHKEDVLARWAALLLAARLNATVVVTAGIHVDGATVDQIALLDKEATELIHSLADRIAKERSSE